MEQLLDIPQLFDIGHCRDDLKALITKKQTQLLRSYGVEHEMRRLLAQLPDVSPQDMDLDQDIIRIGRPGDMDEETRNQFHDLLKKAHPWRKGPFDLFGIHIDTEWQSYIKWNRLKNRIAPLSGRRILDIGSSSGYYMFRMVPQNPHLILGVEPYIRFYAQYRILQNYIAAKNVCTIPAKLEELPRIKAYFHTVFCMGILYHRKSPIETLESIHHMMQKNGELILETLIIQGNDYLILAPEDRYAKMRNVYFIPTVNCLTAWLRRAGFDHIRCVDISPTTETEQRKTEWVNTESLSDFLDPDDLTRTVEGYPAPVRAILIANSR